MVKSRFAHLFDDDEAQKPVPKPKTVRPDFRPYQEGDYENLARAIIQPVVERRFHGGTTRPDSELDRFVDEAEAQERAHAEMLGHDRMLFEGLLLRYGKRWILAELARLLKQFPSYRKDD